MVRRELAVLLGGQVVAGVVRTRAGVLRLTYTGDGDGTPLSLSLPPGERTHSGTPVHAFLDALLPENDRARVAIGRTHGRGSRRPAGARTAPGSSRTAPSPPPTSSNPVSAASGRRS